MCAAQDNAIELIDKLVQEAPTTGCAARSFSQIHPFGNRTAAVGPVTDALAAWARRDDLASWWMTDCYALGEANLALDSLENGVLARLHQTILRSRSRIRFLHACVQNPDFRRSSQRVHQQ